MILIVLSSFVIILLMKRILLPCRCLCSLSFPRTFLRGEDGETIPHVLYDDNLACIMFELYVLA